MNIALHDITVRKGQTTVVENLCLTFPQGEWTAIVGKNGVGKSTVLEVIKGLTTPVMGHIETPPNIGYMFQQVDQQFFEPTVEKELTFTLRYLKTKEAIVQQRLQEMMNLFQLEPSLLEQSPYHLSGGQKKRIALATVLMGEPDVLLLDEPTAGLDATQKEQLLNILKSWQQQGKTIICITHELEDVLQYADNVFVMGNGTAQFLPVEEAFFMRPTVLTDAQLLLPPVVRCFHDISKRLEKPLQTSTKPQQLLAIIAEGVKEYGSRATIRE